MFLSLAAHVANADGQYSEEERAVVKAYCTEMQIPYDEEKAHQSFEAALDELAACGEKEKRIILFELVGLALTDRHFDETERTLMEKAVQALGAAPDYVAACEKCVRTYMKLQEEINQLVLL